MNPVLQLIMNIMLMMSGPYKTCCTGKIIRPYQSPFLVSSPVEFKFLNVLVLNIAEKLLAGR